MPGYRAKRMPLGEWSRFRAAFADFFVASGADRKLALFIEWHRPGDDEPPLVLIPDYLSRVIERLAPGGWHELADATERKWTMLIGNKTAMGDFGLNIAG